MGNTTGSLLCLGQADRRRGADGEDIERTISAMYSNMEAVVQASALLAESGSVTRQMRAITIPAPHATPAQTPAQTPTPALPAPSTSGRLFRSASSGRGIMRTSQATVSGSEESLLLRSSTSGITAASSGGNGHSRSSSGGVGAGAGTGAGVGGAAASAQGRTRAALHLDAGPSSSRSRQQQQQQQQQGPSSGSSSVGTTRAGSRMTQGPNSGGSSAVRAPHEPASRGSSSFSRSRLGAAGGAPGAAQQLQQGQPSHQQEDGQQRERWGRPWEGEGACEAEGEGAGWGQAQGEEEWEAHDGRSSSQGTSGAWPEGEEAAAVAPDVGLAIADSSPAAFGYEHRWPPRRARRQASQVGDDGPVLDPDLDGVGPEDLDLDLDRQWRQRQDQGQREAVAAAAFVAWSRARPGVGSLLIVRAAEGMVVGAPGGASAGAGAAAADGGGGCGCRVVGSACAVCMCDVEAGEAVQLLPCSHVFHEACVAPWFQKSSTCPMCRKDIFAALEEEEAVQCETPYKWRSVSF